MMNPPEGEERGPFQGEPSRLHPAALGVWTLQGIISIVVIVVLTGMVPLVGAGLLAGILGTFLLRYLRFQWRLEPDALIIDEGILIRKRRVIRRERIQTVDLERGISHRLFGVVEVRIEAIGAGGTEGQLAAVSPVTAERLRRVLLGRTRPAAAQVPERASPGGEAKAMPPAPADDPEAWSAEVVLEARPDEALHEEERIRSLVPAERLVVAGLTGGRVGIAAAIVGFLFQSIPETWWTEGMGFLMETSPDPTSVVGIRILAILAIFALLGGFFLSVVATVFTHWDFTLSETDETLVVRRGLFTEHRDTVPYRRVQAVLVEENLVRRALGLGAIRVVVAGRAGGQSGEGTDLLLPIGDRGEIYSIARDVVGMGGEGIPDLNVMPWRARSRRYTRALVAAGAGAVLLVLLLSGRVEASGWLVGGMSFASILLLGCILAEGAYRGLGWVDLDDHLVVREGFFNRRTCFVRADRLQVLESTANPFQRLGGLATLHLRVARPPMAVTPRAVDMGQGGAASWREALAGRVSGGVSRTVERGEAVRTRPWWLGI